jgi:hypothetical protein
VAVKPPQQGPTRPPFELFPHTEKQAKYVIICLALVLLGLIVGGAFYGLGTVLSE